MQLMMYGAAFCKTTNICGNSIDEKERQTPKHSIRLLFNVLNRTS